MSDDLFDAGLWLSVADLARRKGITRQSAGERVDRLEADGKITVRREGRSKLINIAEYDLAVGEVGDAAREAGAATKADEAGDDPKSPQYRDHQTREKQYAADLKLIELNRALGKLVPVDQIADAASRAAEAAIKAIDRLPSYADAVASAVARDGSPGARTKLREIAREIRVVLADAMRGIASAAPAGDIDAMLAEADHDTAD